MESLEETSSNEENISKNRKNVKTIGIVIDGVKYDELEYYSYNKDEDINQSNRPKSGSTIEIKSNGTAVMHNPKLINISSKAHKTELNN